MRFVAFALAGSVLAAGLFVMSGAGRAAPQAPEGRLVEVTGGRLHVVDLAPRGGGKGAPVVLIHGASGNLKDLEQSIGLKLAERRRVILVDRPGHGYSDRLGGREMASPARQATAVAEALRRMEVGPAVVVGHSWAGAVATNLALEHPDRVAALVTLSGATHPYPGGAAWYNEIAATPLLGDLFIALIAGPVGRSQFEEGVKSVFKPRDPPPNYIERTDAMLLLRHGEFKANAEDLVDLKRYLERQAPRYGEIRVPATIVTADKDGIVSPEIHSRVLNRQIAGSKLVVIPGVGHMPHWGATDRVVSVIDALAAKAR